MGNDMLNLFSIFSFFKNRIMLMANIKTSNKHTNQKISSESEQETNKSDQLEVMTFWSLYDIDKSQNSDLQYLKGVAGFNLSKSFFKNRLNTYKI